MRIRALVVSVALAWGCVVGLPAQNPTTITNGDLVVGFLPQCGYAIGDIHSSTIPNQVNAWDCGRDIQTAFYDGAGAYDGCAGCTGVWGWNPVEAGDRYGHSSVIVATAFSASTAYVKSLPLEWYPDNKGGGPTAPVISDIVLERWISFEAGGVKVVNRVTHVGADTHANALQETPAVYAPRTHGTLVYYAGASPWTNGALTTYTLPEFGTAQPTLYAPEDGWFALSPDGTSGLSIYAPRAYLWPGGGVYTAAGDEATAYGRMATALSLGPGEVKEFTYYAFIGAIATARASIVSLHSSASDSWSPIGALETPAPGATLSGTVMIAGWALDNVAMSLVDIVVNGAVVGHATLGQSRPDVPGVYPGAPTNAGFSYAWNTKPFKNTSPTILIRAVDSSGNVSTFGQRTVTIASH